jgi:hypothetical protein
MTVPRKGGDMQKIPHRYPKIENLLVRQMEGPCKGKILPGEYKEKSVTLLRPDYAWKFTEKIHGMNIRIYYSRLSKEKSSPDPPNHGVLSPDAHQWFLGGKTDAAQLPGPLVVHLNQLMEEVFPRMCEKLDGNLIFFGEGYGAGINKGGGYADGQQFILFDIMDADTGYFFKWSAVQGLGEALGFEVVPELPEVYTMTDAVNIVRQGFKTLVGKGEAQAEGIVARSEPEFYNFRDGGFKPLRWKLKTADFPKEN